MLFIDEILRLFLSVGFIFLVEILLNIFLFVNVFFFLFNVSVLYVCLLIFCIGVWILIFNLIFLMFFFFSLVVFFFVLKISFLVVESFFLFFGRILILGLLVFIFVNRLIVLNFLLEGWIVICEILICV